MANRVDVATPDSRTFCKAAATGGYSPESVVGLAVVASVEPVPNYPS